MKTLFLISIVFTLSALPVSGQSIERRVTPPAGYVREACDLHSFTAYLRTLSLLPAGSKVFLYNGQVKRNQAAAYAVIDMEIGNRDLQQCADAVIRLRAEYLWAQKRYDEIKFNFTSGFPAEYKKWAEGNRIKVNGNKVEWYAATAPDLVDKERQLELAYQAERSYDVFRNGKSLIRRYPGPHTASEDIMATDFRVVYYIPQTAINSYPSGSTLTQNPTSN